MRLNGTQLRDIAAHLTPIGTRVEGEMVRQVYEESARRTLGKYATGDLQEVWALTQQKPTKRSKLTADEVDALAQGAPRDRDELVESLLADRENFRWIAQAANILFPP